MFRNFEAERTNLRHFLVAVVQQSQQVVLRKYEAERTNLRHFLVAVVQQRQQVIFRKYESDGPIYATF